MYESRSGSPLDLFLLFLYLTLCIAGGWLLIRTGFRLPPKDRPLVGAALGVALSTWLSNLLGHVVGPPIAFWLAPLLLVGAGIAAWRGRPDQPHGGRDMTSMWLVVAVVALAILFSRMGRGLAIFDDRKNLSLISLMAAGEIPPRFYMNPDFYFAYHYAFQLFGAALMRIGNLFPWSAFDLAKGIAAALAIGLSVVWGRRAAGKWATGIWAGAVVLFASGSRWLLLVLPASVLSAAGRGMEFWGTAADLPANLTAALSSSWGIDGGPPIPLPFAFVNGILQPFVLHLQTGPISMSLIALLAILILFPARARGWSWAILVALFAFWALAAEAAFVLFALGTAIACIFLLVAGRRRGRPRELLIILGILAVALCAALLQGGTLTEVARGLASGRAPAGGASDVAGFSLREAPAIVSAHLGELRLGRPAELLVGLFELGPALLFAPLAAWMMIHAARRGKTIVLGLAISTFLGFLLPIFLRYEVDRDITRLTQYALLGWILLAAAPVTIVWMRGRSVVRGAIAAVTAILAFGGVLVSGVLLTAVPRAVSTDGFLPADTAMIRLVWDRLERDALVIDSDSWRAVPITGRLTRSAPDSSTLLEGWQALVEHPIVGRLVAAGFDYAYVDTRWWKEMSDDERRGFEADCVLEVASVHDNGANGDRWLYDLRRCPPG